MDLIDQMIQMDSLCRNSQKGQIGQCSHLGWMSQMDRKSQMSQMCQKGHKCQMGQGMVYVDGLGLIRFDLPKI